MGSSIPNAAAASTDPTSAIGGLISPPNGGRTAGQRVVAAVLLAASLVGCGQGGHATDVGPSPSSVSAAEWRGSDIDPPSSDAVFGFSPGAELRTQDDAHLAGDLDAMRAAGAGWVRLDIDWSVVEADAGVYDWSGTDRLVDAAAARGLDILGLVAYSPGWATGEGLSDKAPPDDDRAFASFAADAADRYRHRGVRTWQIWNEPNSSLFWEGGPDPERYGVMLALTADAIRAVAPDAVIISGGLAPAVDRPEDGWLSPETYLTRLIDSGALRNIDAVAVHPYSFPARPLDPASSDWNTFLRLPDIHRMLARSEAAPNEIWITEYGAPTGSHDRAVSETEQAAMVTEALAAAGSWPWLGPLFLYSHRDYRSRPDELEQNYGLLNVDGSPKKAWHAVLRWQNERP